MKKLIILVALLISAISVNAASFNWIGKKLSGPSNLADATTFKLTDATAYLYSEVISDLAIDSAQIKSSSVPATKINFNKSTDEITQYKNGNEINADDYVSFYYKIVGLDSAGNEWTYTSASTTAMVKGTGATSVDFGSTMTGSWAMTKAAGGGGEGGSEGVPEPTSALLTMLGLAGLALRRKQK